MVSQTLPIEDLILRFFSMFCLGNTVRFAKNLYFVAVLCSVLALVTCKRCSVTDVSNQLDAETCRSCGANYETSYPDVFGGHNSSEMVSRSSVQHRSLENLCPPSNSFCFPSTLSGVLFDEIGSKLEVLDDYGEFPTGPKQVGSSKSGSFDSSVFQLLDGRTILCSLQQQDGFERQTEISSCIRPPSDHKTHVSKSGENIDTAKFDSLDDLSTPPVEINPSQLDWGRTNMYRPSLAFLTVKNIDSDGTLSIYHPYSSNLQFYPCNFNETLLDPGKVASICFVFFPTKLGLSSAQLVLQTSVGGFLVQAKGFAVESPYLIKPLSGLDVSSIGRWRKNLSLFNPFNETLYVEEINARISSGSSKIICSIHNVKDSSDYNMSSAKDWLDVESGVVGSPCISVRPHMNWEIAPQKREAVMELDISQPFEGKIVGAFCLLLRSSTNSIDTLMVPLDVELSPGSAMDNGHVSVFLETLVPCRPNGSIIFALSVRNDYPDSLNVIEVREVGDGTNTFEIKSVEGLLLFPRTTTQVAILNYTHLGTPQADLRCKLLVTINDSRISQMEIPCIDVINICSKDKGLDSSLGYAREINNIVYIKGRQTSNRSSIQAPSEIKAMDSNEAEEFVLRNWKSQATENLTSVLDNNELLFPTVHVGNYCFQWIAVKNPSQQPVAMQLILNSGEVIDKCRTSELLLPPSSSRIFLSDKLSSRKRYGFSLAENAITEALIHPYGSASLGPILFQPSNRCEWRSSALVRNNLSGVEWIALRGFGGSLSMVFLEESEPVQGLEFKLKLPSKLNSLFFASTENSSSCYQPLIKEVYAKNSGDLSMEVIRIDVSGSQCGLDGFRVHNCKGFSLQPGESMRLQLSYQTDFSSATIQRNLELSLATGILVIPMKASLPMYMLNFCKRSMFWMLVKKAMVVVLVAASLLFLLVNLFLPCVTTFLSHDIRKKSSSTVNLLDRSIEKEEASTLQSSDKSPDCYVSGKGHDDPASKYQMTNKSLLGAQPEFRLLSGLSKSLCVVSSDVQDATESRNLRVIIGKEKVRRRKKKKSSTIGPFELSSSQSGNSTPSSPLSPLSSITPKRSCLVSPDMEQSVENRNPFAQAPDRKCNGEKSSDIPYMVNSLENEVSSKCRKKNRGCSPLETPSLIKKVASRAVLTPSATFPSAWRVAPPTWSCQSPYLASTSRVAPHARAPGSKLQNQQSGEYEERTVFKKEIGVGEKAGLEENFTYDIWGDHLFELPVTHSVNDSPSKCPRVIECNSESFFVRGPPTLFSHSHLNPVSSKIEGNE